MSKDNKFGLPRIFRRPEYKEAEMRKKELEQQRELAEKQSKLLEKSLFWTKILAGSTIVLAIATIGVALYTASLVDSQNKLLQREELLEGSYLSVWQKNLTRLTYHKSLFIKQNSSSTDIIYANICFRNEGKISTGPISIYSESINFTVTPLQSSYENIESHTGNCTLLGIYNCIESQEKCENKNIPLGNIIIPISFYCSLCKESIIEMNYNFCIFNQTENECK